MIFLIIGAIVFSISFIITFEVSASASTDTLYSVSFLRVALSYWVNIDVACFTFDALVGPVAVEAPRDSIPGEYISPPVKDASSPRSDISSPAGSRAKDYLPSSEASSYSADS